MLVKLTTYRIIPVSSIVDVEEDINGLHVGTSDVDVISR
jgi:hypothetical protein